MEFGSISPGSASDRSIVGAGGFPIRDADSRDLRFDRFCISLGKYSCPPKTSERRFGAQKESDFERTKVHWLQGNVFDILRNGVITIPVSSVTKILKVSGEIPDSRNPYSETDTETTGDYVPSGGTAKPLFPHPTRGYTRTRYYSP